MTDDEYFEALRAAIEDGDQQAAAVLRMLETRGMIPREDAALMASAGSLWRRVSLVK